MRLYVVNVEQSVDSGTRTKPVKGIQSSSTYLSSAAVYLHGYCATYVGMQSVALAETKRTSDYQTTVFDCVNQLLERSTGNQEGSEICTVDKQQHRVRVNYLFIYFYKYGLSHTYCVFVH